MSRIFHFILTLLLIIIVSSLINKNHKHIRIRFIIQTLIIEIICAHFFLHSTTGLTFITKFSDLFKKLLFFAQTGIDFVFNNMNKEELSFFFLNVLCPIIFISALIGILKYFKILSISIQIIGTILSKINGMGKLESFNAVSSLIFGQSENFITYKNILDKIPEQRMYTLAATSMSTISMSIIGVYMNILTPKYVITAVFLNMFSSFIVLSILNPYPTNKNENLEKLNFDDKNQNIFEILGEYILIGSKITMMITAMLIGFIGIISAINELCDLIFNISFQKILGYLFSPLAWIIGIPKYETIQVGSIMATKLISNEFIAIINLQKIENNLSEQSILITSIFLVSFSNFSSIGIMTGALKGLNTKQGKLISKQGIKIVCTSTLINLLSASIAGLIN